MTQSNIRETVERWAAALPLSDAERSQFVADTVARAWNAASETLARHCAESVMAVAAREVAPRVGRATPPPSGPEAPPEAPAAPPA